MKTNKFLNMLLLSALTLPFFTACESDTDSNPTFQEAPSFVLNESAYAANNTYDLSVTNTTVQISCNQPNYGFPVATTYAVQVAFSEAGFDSGEFVELGSTFNNTQISIDASELNSSLTDLWGVVYKDLDVPTEAVSIYLRLRAVVTGQSIGNSYSNIICLSHVLMSANAVTLELPEFMWLAGTMNGWVHKPMAKVFGLDGQYYKIIYLEDGGQFKFGTKEGEWCGADDSRLTIVNNASGDVADDGTDNHNITFSKGGWYTIFFKTVVKGKDYAFTMTVSPAKVYIIGACEGGNWSLMDDWMFTDSGNGTLVSPPLAAAGEVRMCVDAGLDWWRTEFTLQKSTGNIYYRNVDIPDNWASNVGDDYSIQGTTGMVIELDFNNGTGSTK